jgi:hypothetical protein
MANIRKAKVGLEDRLWRERGRRQGRGRRKKSSKEICEEV